MEKMEEQNDYEGIFQMTQESNAVKLSTSTPRFSKKISEEKSSFQENTCKKSKQRQNHLAFIKDEIRKIVFTQNTQIEKEIQETLDSMSQIECTCEEEDSEDEEVFGFILESGIQEDELREFLEEITKSTLLDFEKTQEKMLETYREELQKQIDLAETQMSKNDQRLALLQKELEVGFLNL